MGLIVEIAAESGAGKSYSQRNMDPKSTFLLNCDQKPVPFPGVFTEYDTQTGKGNMISRDYLGKDGKKWLATEPETVSAWLTVISEKKPEVKAVIIDTCNLLMLDHEMRHYDTAGWDKWADLAKDVYSIFRMVPNLRPDLIVYGFFHSEAVTDENTGRTKERIKTQGRRLQKIILESLATIVLWGDVHMVDGVPQHKFATKSNGIHPAKTPPGLFDAMLIDNDLKVIDQQIRNFYNL